MKLSVALFAVLSLLLSLAGTAAAQPVRPAEKGMLGTPVHFTLEADESKDIAFTLPKGEYIVQADLKLVDAVSSNIQMKVSLLKINGALVEERILSANEIHRVARVARPLRMAKPLAARLRVTNSSKPMEFWLTVVPVAKRVFLPFPYTSDAIQPLAVGTDNGKGGNLAKSAEDGFFTYHKIALPAGKYDVSLYLKQTDSDRSNLQGSILLLDRFGVPDSSNWKLGVNEIDKEVRKDKRLVLVKPATVLLLVTNTNSSKVYDYTVGIEKATD